MSWRIVSVASLSKLDYKMGYCKGDSLENSWLFSAG